MYNEALVLFGSLLTAVGVSFVGLSATDGKWRRRSEKRLFSEEVSDVFAWLGTVASIVGALLLATPALHALCGLLAT